MGIVPDEIHTETIWDGDYPTYTITVTAPAGVWRQSGTEQPGYVDFMVYPVMALGGKTGEEPKIMYETVGGGGFCDLTSELAEAAWVARGSVKWDGCANWQTDGNGAKLHHCGADTMGELFDAVNRAYSLCWERVGAWLQ